MKMDGNGSIASQDLGLLASTGSILKRCPHLSLGVSAILLALGFSVSQSAEAKLLRILHTNDLHSHFEHAGNPARGSFAGVKLMMDTLRAESARDGIEVITLDAGDFTEGGEFFLAGQGEESIRLMGAMGYDAVALGNHDGLMGLSDLDHLLGRMPPRFPILGANFIYNPGSRNLRRHIKPWIEMNRGGMKIAILGLTTAELFYRWRVESGFICDPIEEADRDLAILRPRNDVVIALTHLGVDEDRRLARDSRGLDLIVGGHSHTVLPEAILETDHSGNKVPIVQTGEHGAFLGELLLDVVPGKPAKLLSYQLIPIYRPEAPIGSEVEGLVTLARTRLEQDYHPEWLYETIGDSAIPMDPPSMLNQSTRWGRLVGDAMRETTHSEIALNTPQFFGNPQPAGPVTREKIMAFFPRVFEANQKNGWHVWEVKVSGWVIKQMIKTAFEVDQYPDFTGVTYQRKVLANGKLAFSDYKVNGQPLQDFRTYTMAVPEGMARGVIEIAAVTEVLFRARRNSFVTMWEAIERKVRELGRVTEDN